MLREAELETAEVEVKVMQRGEVSLPVLARRVGLTTLQRLQKQFASLAKATIGLTTIDGGLITEPTWGSRFSEMIATSPVGREAFANDLVVFAADITSSVAFIGQPGTKLYAAPIERAGERLGLIVVGTRSDHVLTDQEIGALAGRLGLDVEALKEAAGVLEPWDEQTCRSTCQFAHLLADTIALLYAQAVRIERQVADLRTVHELANLLAGTSDLQEILDRTVRRVVEVMGVKACGIRLLDEEKGELVVKAVCNLSNDYLQKGKVLIGDSMIDTVALRGETVYIPDAPNDSRLRYPEYARKEGIVSCLCVPMIYRGQTVGLLRVYTDRRYVFDATEESLLRSIASQAASAIINARLREARKEMRYFEQQLRHGREIQRRMLPAGLPDHAGLLFGCAYRPSLQLAGDFYDFLYLSDDAIGLCVADVMGKGLPAALLMASIRSSLRAHAHSIFDLDEILFQVNRNMCRDTLLGEFASLFYGVFWNGGTRFTYCNAGHPPPLLFRGGAFQELGVGGPVIGVMPTECFEKKVISLREGDTLVFFSDGVTEALDFQGEAYSSGRLRESIRRHRALETQHMADQLLWDVRRFVGLAEQSDDITIVVVKVSRAKGTGR
jgi:sigma-B regulation protein RsbU (phosphoserine phosphatase)